MSHPWREETPSDITSLFRAAESATRTSSVYLIILSASDVYSVATKTRSVEIDLSQKRGINPQARSYGPCGVCEYLLPGRQSLATLHSLSVSLTKTLS